MFCWSQNVINGTDKVRSKGTVKISTLRSFLFYKGPLLAVLYLSLSQKSHLYVFGARSGREFLSGLGIGFKSEFSVTSEYERDNPFFANVNNGKFAVFFWLHDSSYENVSNELVEVW